jgi:hypothetical protein
MSIEAKAQVTRPEFDGTRAGVGIFPPKNPVKLKIRRKL